MENNWHEDFSPLPDMIKEQTLQTWMEQYGSEILRTATMLLQDRHLAEDVSQETFLTAFQKCDQLMEPLKARSWLIRIAINLCHSRMRKAAWRRLIFRDFRDEAQRQMGNPVAGPDEMVPIRISVIDSIRQLPYAYREIIVMYYYHSLSIEEISQTLNEPVGTIKSKLSRARAKLRQRLGEEWMA